MTGFVASRPLTSYGPTHKIFVLINQRAAKGLCCLHTESMGVDEGSDRNIDPLNMCIVIYCCFVQL